MRTSEAEIAQFNRRWANYALTGLTAFQTLQKLMKDGYFGVDIAAHFEVSENTVVAWKKKFFRNRIDSLSA